MKRTLLALAGLLTVSSLLSAARLCTPGTVASYIALGTEGCSIGNATFANFAYAAKASGGTQQIPPDQVKVEPLEIPFNPRLTFSVSAKWQALSGQTQESFIKYTVVPLATGLNTGVLVLQLGASKGLFGKVEIQENTDLGDLECFTNCTEVCSSRNIDTLQFWPLSTLQVVDHVSLSSRQGKTSLASFTATFNLCFLCP